MHGSGLEGLHGLPAISLYAPAERERVRIFYDTADRTGQVVFEADRLRKDGSVFPSEVHISSVSGENSDVLYRIVTVRDITSRRQMQAELDESRRFEAIGQLTAGVAHDFNNLLQGIISNLELIDDDVGVAPATRECVAFAVRLAERGGEVAHRLLSFSRKQLLVPKALDLDEFLLAFRELLSHTLNPRIRITLEIARGLAPVWIDPAHLQTTLLNLAINARDAMPSGGNLTIEALGTPDVVAVRADSASLDRFAIIRISDTGTGIAADILAKVCEPFFSTKGLNGTGLGLSMAEGFLKQSGGDLRITSKLGKGTCVALWLPLAPTVATVAGAPC
jgi:PAS domain S-box-containing protein